MQRPFLLRLVELVGKEKVLASEPELLCYSYDATPLVSFRPDAVVRAGIRRIVRSRLRDQAPAALNVRWQMTDGSVRNRAVTPQ